MVIRRRQEWLGSPPSGRALWSDHFEMAAGAKRHPPSPIKQNSLIQTQDPLTTAIILKRHIYQYRLLSKSIIPNCTVCALDKVQSQIMVLVTGYIIKRELYLPQGQYFKVRQ